MSQLAEQLLQQLKQRPNQTARDLATALGLDKKEINSCLYGALRGQVVQSSSYRWSLASQATQAARQQPEVPRFQDTDLAKLCRYYLACMGQDEVGVSTFAASNYGEPDYQELEVLPGNSDALVQQEGCRRLIGKVKKEQGRWDLFFGYPTSLKHLQSRRSNWQGYMVEPILLFPVDLDGDTPYLDLSYPIVNQKALQQFTGAQREALMEELVQLEQELGLGKGDQQIELDELALRLQAIRPEWPWLEQLDPDALGGDLSLAEIAQAGILNRAVVIMSERSPFTKGLEAELRQLAQLSPQQYEHTALGAWLKGHLPAMQEATSRNDLLEVLPMNLEQRQAVSSAISNPLTIITGPPGTGKSQVVTNLLVNAAWQGKQVLFASKNNKAVDVVETRVNNLGPRPLLLRIGSQQYQTRLAEFLMALLSVTASSDDRIYFEEAERLHRDFQQALAQLDKQVDSFVGLRNEVDMLEQAAEAARETLPAGIFEVLKEAPIDDVLDQLDAFKRYLDAADRELQDFFTKLLWFMHRKERVSAADQQLPQMAELAKSFAVMGPLGPMDEVQLPRFRQFADALDSQLQLAKTLERYTQALHQLQISKPLEQLARERVDKLEQIAANSQVLWKYWLRLQPTLLSQQDRSMLNRYTSLLKMVMDTGPDAQLARNVYREYHSLFGKVSHLLPCWAVTSLSARGKIPFQAGFFDLVVFDEASQCDIASALPLLYRAKRAAVIGDPKQLAHISGLQKGQDQQLLDKFGLVESFPHWGYSVNSLFDLAAGLVGPQDVVSLLDHHRSHADVIEFSNQQFYEGRLRVATRYDNLKRPSSKEAGVRWQHVEGQVMRPASGGALNRQEVDAIVRLLEELALQRGYQGSIGVVSPFRAQANAIRAAVEKHPALSAALLERQFLVDTVHKFQGDERDIMVFSPVLAKGITPGAIGFLRNNGNLFNVAITRARAQLIVVGDMTTCGQSEIDYLANFAKYAKALAHREHVEVADTMQDLGPQYPAVSNPHQVSDWERILYQALYRAGIRTVPQFQVEKYALDLALMDGERSLNIEIDGERYHRAWTGELCRRDQIRNQRMFELGWDVMRFWVYEIRDDLDGCVAKVQRWLNQSPV